MHGSFWQPLLADLARDRRQWQQWTDDLAALGVRRLVIQHVALEPYEVLVSRARSSQRAGDATARADPADSAAPGGTALARVLEAAAEREIAVWLGLSVDPEYFRHVGQADDGAVRQYLRQRLTRTLSLAHALGEAARHRAVRGWYIGDEIDDLNWTRPERAELLARWLAEVTAALTLVQPAASIAVSGFVNAASTSPRALAAQWRRWFAAAPRLDEVLFQDGVGAAKVPLADSERYLGAVAEAAAAARRRFTPVVELFEAVPAAAVGTFRSAAAPRVLAQIGVADRVAGDWVAFSAPEYLLADNPPAQALRRALAAGMPG